MPRKSKKYHFIYKTTNKLTNQYYIGMHSTHNLNDDYIGSGKKLWYSINKYGRDNHIFEILEYLSDRNSLKNREKEIVNYDLLKDNMCLNLNLGGTGGWYCANSNSDLQKEKNKKALKKLKWLEENDKEWLELKLKRLSISQKNSYLNGRIPITPNWNGRKHKEDSKEKMKNTHLLNNHQKGEKNSQYGTCWIHNINMKENKRINKNDIENWLSIGWIKGRKMKF